MTSSRQKLMEANGEAREQRNRLRAQIIATKERLAPSRLADDARQTLVESAREVRDDAAGSVRDHPVATAAGVAALVAWIFRKPLLRHAPPSLQAAYDRIAGHRWEPGDATPAPSDR